MKFSLCVSLVLEVKSLSRVCLFATLWTVAHQASPSMEFSRQEYWNVLPFWAFPLPKVQCASALHVNQSPSKMRMPAQP